MWIRNIRPSTPLSFVTILIGVCSIAVVNPSATAGVIHQYCDNIGVCVQTWTFGSTDRGAYQQDGLSTVANQNYLVGSQSVSPPGSFDVWRNFFVFDINQQVTVSSSSNRLIGELRIRWPSGGGGPYPGGTSYHVFDVLHGLSFDQKIALTDAVIDGSGGISAYTRLGGQIPFQTDFGIANTFALLDGIVTLNLHGIAAVVNAPSTGNNNRVVFGGVLEDINGNLISGIDLIAFLGSDIFNCPECGAELILAEVPRGISVPEPGVLGLFGIGLAGLVFAGHKRRRQY